MAAPRPSISITRCEYFFVSPNVTTLVATGLEQAVERLAHFRLVVQHGDERAEHRDDDVRTMGRRVLYLG